MDESNRASRDGGDSIERTEDDGSDSYEEDRSSEENDDTDESVYDYSDADEYDDSDYSNRDNDNEDDYDEFDAIPFINAEDTVLAPTSAPTLEDLASLSIAIALWNHATVLTPKSATYDDLCEVDRQVAELTSQLSLPKSFAKCIEFQLTDVVEEMDGWIRYHRKEIFLEKKSEFELLHYKRCIVWNPNPTVNYYQTALNLLKSDELSDLEKYRLCCTYCLKEEIEKLWQTLLGNEELTDKKISSKHPLVNYWNYYCAGELHMMKTRRDLTIDEFMIRRVENWSAIEYFYDRLDAEKQVASAIFIIDSHIPRYQKLVLMKLNECQRLQVYAERAVLIIQNYAEFTFDDVYASDAISAWYEVRDSFNQDEFVSLLKALLSNQTADVVLMEIWTSSYSELKRHVCTLSSYDFIGDVFHWAAREDSNSNGFDFLFAVLKDGAKINISTAKGKELFLSLCQKMIYHYELDSLARLLNLCVSDAEQCADFKLLLAKKSCTNACCKKLIKEHEFLKVDKFLKFFHLKNIPKSKQIVEGLLLENLKHIDDYCLSFYADGNVKALNAALAPLQSSYPEVIPEYKRYLLFSKEGLEACCSHFNSTTDILSEIVTDSLPDARVAIQFGKKIIFSKLGISKLLTLIRDENFPNEIVKRIVNLFLKSNKDKRKLKTKLSYCITPEEQRIDREAKKKFIRVLNELF